MLRPRDAFRPSPRLAFQISLGVHALFVLMLFRMYSEYSIQPSVPLHIVARSSAPRDAATPSFVAVPLADVAVADEPHRPAARIDSLPHQSVPFAERTIVPKLLALPVARRTTAPAVLPVPGVAVPVVVTTSEEITPAEFDSVPVAANQSSVSLERTDTIRDLPLHIASRPIYGPRPQRPLGLATLPQSVGSEQELKPASAFAHRRAGLRIPLENRTPIDRGLEFLARVQLDDGRWQFRNLRDTVDPNAELPSARADAAATGLVLLAFLGAGHDHFDGRYRLVVDDGIKFLVGSQLAHGEFFPEDGRPTGELTKFYSHGIATLALTEAFGMTGDERLRAPAQRALDYLVGTHRNVPGAWRFLPGLDADASTIGWQLATLRSGQLAGLYVQPQTIDVVRAYLARGRDNESQPASTVNTAVELAVQLHLGGSSGTARLRPAADQLLAHPPEFGDAPDPAAAPQTDNARRDTYYWYYGSEAMFYLGGNEWQAWSQQLYPRLIQFQTQDGPLAGSWDPRRSTAQSVSAAGGRLYVTAMNLLSLEIQNRHLPPDPNNGKISEEVKRPE
jgi:hypothetical protein